MPTSTPLDEISRLKTDNQRLKTTLSDLVTHYHGSYDQQQQLQSDFSGPNGLLTYGQVRDLVWQNAQAVLRDRDPQQQVDQATALDTTPQQAVSR